MRPTTTFLLASFMIGSVACASSATNSGPTEANEPQAPGSDQGNGETNQPQAEKPLTPRAICATVDTDASFGKSCSGTGRGEEVCAFTSSQCGANECVYDTRKADMFDFYCAPKCNAADKSLGCPLGYECVVPTASCAGPAVEGVCARSTGFACKDVGDATGTFVEGLDGVLYVLSWSGSQGSLREKTASGWRTLTTWSETSTYNLLAGVARSGARLLIVTSGYEIVLEDGTAKATKRSTSTTSTSYTPAVGVAADGSFVALEQANGNYATLSKRAADGKWTEVGPTKKRIASLNVLGIGFVARCGKDLCTSADGESFDVLAAPPDVVITETSRFVASGPSHEDFYFAVDGRLFHQRKGKWVEEGPRGAAPNPNGSSSGYQDILRTSSTGAVAFYTWNGTSYTSYVAKADGECWKTTTADNLNSATLVGDTLMWTTYSRRELCSLKVE